MCRGDPEFEGVVVGLGALGAVTRVTLEVEPSYAVGQRTGEIGVRIALGAQRLDIFRLQGVALALGGVGIGLVGTLSLTRWLTSLLFGISATDPLTFASVALLLTFVALLAAICPDH